MAALRPWRPSLAAAQTHVWSRWATWTATGGSTSLWGTTLEQQRSRAHEEVCANPTRFFRSDRPLAGPAATHTTPSSSNVLNGAVTHSAMATHFGVRTHPKLTEPPPRKVHAAEPQERPRGDSNNHPVASFLLLGRVRCFFSPCKTLVGDTQRLKQPVAV